MTARTPKYWEQIRDEMVSIMDELFWDTTVEVISFPETRKAAIERLYVRGIYQEIQF